MGPCVLFLRSICSDSRFVSLQADACFSLSINTRKKRALTVPYEKSLEEFSSSETDQSQTHQTLYHDLHQLADSPITIPSVWLKFLER